MNRLLSYKILGNTLAAWGTAFLITLFGFLLLWMIRKLAERYISKGSGDKRWGVMWMTDSLLKKTYLPLFLMSFFYFGSLVLNVSPRVLPWMSGAVMATLIIQVAVWAVVIVNLAADRYQEKSLTDTTRVTTLRAVKFTINLLILVISLLLILSNIPGVNISTLVASLGIGGIAVALAVQNILSDLFASFSIMFDKPFVIGDFIIVDTFLGTVDHIGLKTTRLRSLSGEQLVFSNNDLLKSRIRNYKRMFERRVVFSIGVLYDTPLEKLKEIPGWIRTTIEALEKTRFDRSHFQSFGDYALNFETVYYVLDSDYNRYMDIQQSINLTIFEKFASEGVGFAFPTRTIHIADSGETAPETQDARI